MMWASASKLPQDTKPRSILGMIKRGICEHLKRSSDSMIIDGPSKSIYAIEGGDLKKIASVIANYKIKQEDSISDEVKIHVLLLMSNRELDQLRSDHVSPPRAGGDDTINKYCTHISMFTKNVRINSLQRIRILLAELSDVL